MGAGQAMDPNLAGEFPARYTHPVRQAFHSTVTGS